MDYTKKYDTFGPEDAPVREARTCARFSWPRRLTLGLGLGRSFTVGRAAARSRGHPQIVRPPNRSPQGLLSPRPAGSFLFIYIYLFCFLFTYFSFLVVVHTVGLQARGARPSRPWLSPQPAGHHANP